MYLLKCWCVVILSLSIFTTVTYIHFYGIENSWNRHQQNHILLRDGLNNLGINYLVDEASRLPQLNSVLIPQDQDDLSVRSSLIKNYNIDIGAGLGPLEGNIWRIGLMGYSSRRENVTLLLTALKELL